MSTEDAVKGTNDRCLLNNKTFAWIFSGNDDVLTYRGVSIYDDKQKVFDLYRISSIISFDK